MTPMIATLIVTTLGATVVAITTAAVDEWWTRVEALPPAGRPSLQRDLLATARATVTANRKIVADATTVCVTGAIVAIAFTAAIAIPLALMVARHAALSTPAVIGVIVSHSLDLWPTATFGSALVIFGVRRQKHARGGKRK